MKLRAFECRWGAAVGRAIVIPEVLDGATAQIDLSAAFRKWSSRAPWYTVMLLRIALWLVWFGPLWVLGRPRAFSAVSPAERERVLEVLLYSRWYLIRQPMAFLKLAVCLMTLGDESVLARIGAYDLAPARRAALRSLP